MKIVIIGNGVAGTTAAIEVRKKSQAEILLVSEESQYPYSRPALMYIFMGHLPFENTKLEEDHFWKENNIELLQDSVSALNIQGKFVKLKSGNVTNYDKLILATGSVANKFGWPGQDLERVQCFYNLHDLKSIEEACHKGIKHAVIVGGGLIGIEVAEMLHSRHIEVTMVVREMSFWDNVLPEEESKMINEHIRKQGINLLLESEIQRIDGDKEVESVILKNGNVISCQFVALTVGVSPQIKLTQGTDIEVKKGILVDKYLQTTHKDIFAIGDCAELQSAAKNRRTIEAVWYAAKEMGKTVAANIVEANSMEYNPGTWYNSAKFFDVEYQVYGQVPTKYDENIKSIFWQHTNEDKSMRIVYENESKKVIGLNLMGIRYRQDVCISWIEKGSTLEQVMQELSFANFDPEFFTQYEQALIAQYNEDHNGQLKLSSARNLSLVHKFLTKMKSYAQS